MKVITLAVAAALVAALLVALPAAGAPNPLAKAAALITGRQIANSSITGKDVRNKSLTTRDFRGSVRGPRGSQGPPGPQGPAGPTVLGRIVRVEASKTIAAGDIDSVTVGCPAGYGVVSGGWVLISGLGVPFYEDTFGSRTSWTVGMDNFSSSTSATGTAIAFCAPAGQALTPAKASGNIRERINALEARQRAAHR